MKLQNIILAALVVAVGVLALSMPSEQPGTPGVQGVQGLKGDKGDKGDTGARGLTGPKGADAVSLGAVVSPDFPSSWLCLGGGACEEGNWATLAQGTTSVFAANPAQTGIFGTSTLTDAMCRFSATNTIGALVTFYKVSSDYGYGIATNSLATTIELASTTIDLAAGKGPAFISLLSSTSSILGDIDMSHFEFSAKEALVNHWNPRTDFLLVNVSSKNLERLSENGNPANMNFSGSCAGFWRTLK